MMNVRIEIPREQIAEFCNLHVLEIQGIREKRERRSRVESMLERFSIADLGPQAVELGDQIGELGARRRLHALDNTLELPDHGLDALHTFKCRTQGANALVDGVLLLIQYAYHVVYGADLPGVEKTPWDLISDTAGNRSDRDRVPPVEC